jgi:predicted permease
MADWKARVRERLAGLDLDPATEAETIEELTQHVEDGYRDLIASGVTEDAAAAQAWRELEGHDRLAREISGARKVIVATPIQYTSGGGISALWDDFCFAWRRLRHAPGFALVALLTVMLTVGANTAILSVADAVLFRPLPYADADNVAIIQMINRKSGTRATRIDYEFLHAMDAGCPSVSAVALLEPYSGKARPVVETADGTTSVESMEATPNYFELLGVRPVRGRIFTTADRGSDGVIAMLSYTAWQQMFGRDESIVGRSITLGPASFQIAGVLPAGFVFPSVFAGRPSIVVMRKDFEPGEKGGTFHAIARIPAGVSRDRAQAEIDSATAQVSATLPRSAGIGPVLDDVRTVLYPVGRPIMRYLLAAAGLILLLGCANLANMMLVRGRRRLHETAIRLALGAGRARLILPLLFEALIIGMAGAALAVILTAVSFEALLRQVPPIAYGRADVGVSLRIVLIALGMGFLCGLAFSIVPAWRASGVDVLALIQRRAGRGGRISRGRPMLAAQVAVAVAVVFGAVLAGRAFVSVLRTPLGFSPENVLRISLSVPRDVKDFQAYYERVIRGIAARSDAVAAGAAGSVPFSRDAPNEGARPLGAEQTAAGIVHALPGYFEAVGIELRRGRFFTWDDARADPNVAVVSESGARALFQDRDPLGAVFTNGRGRDFRVIGVVGDVMQSLGDARSNGPRVYAMPGPQSSPLNVMARMRERREASVAAIKTELRAMSPRAPDVEWWDDQISLNSAYRDPRFQAIILGGLAVLALGLTALGIFSVVAYLVAARTREMGVRLAIGASPESLVVLIIRQVFLPITIGLAAGVLLIWWGRGLAEAQLFRVETKDPMTLAAAGATVLFAALLAAYLPARRATRISPTEVLRAE